MSTSTEIDRVIKGFYCTFFVIRESNLHNKYSIFPQVRRKSCCPREFAVIMKSIRVGQLSLTE